MAITLTPSYQRVVETSYAVTDNSTGYLRLYLKSDGHNGSIATIGYKITLQGVNPYYSDWLWNTESSYNYGIWNDSAYQVRQSIVQGYVYNSEGEVTLMEGSWTKTKNWSSTYELVGYIHIHSVSKVSDTVVVPQKAIIASPINGTFKNLDVNSIPEFSWDISGGTEPITYTVKLRKSLSNILETITTSARNVVFSKTFADFGLNVGDNFSVLVEAENSAGYDNKAFNFIVTGNNTRVWININDVWVRATTWININGEWKKTTGVKINNNGTWTNIK